MCVINHTDFIPQVYNSSIHFIFYHQPKEGMGIYAPMMMIL